MIDPDFLARVAAGGGDPQCLHCRLSVLINEHFEKSGEAPTHALQIAAALAEIAGELIAPAPDSKREGCLDSVIGLMREKCATMAARGVPPALSRDKLH